MNTKKGNSTKRIFICMLSLVMILALSIAGILLIGAGTEYTYHDIDAYTWQDVLDAVATDPADFDHDGINIVLQNDINSTESLTIPAGTRVKLSGDYELNFESSVIFWEWFNPSIFVNNAVFTIDNATVNSLMNVTNNSVFNILDGEVNGNVFINNSVFNMYDGSIVPTSLWEMSSGVNVTNSIFNMHGGTISGNSSWTIVQLGNSVFNMYAGEISGNEHGSGVHLNNDTVFNMHGGSIKNNHWQSNAFGGGVTVRSNSVFNMYNGIISGNISYMMGGGVYIEGGCFYMNGGEISNNSATWGGGGVSIGQGGNFTMNNGIISHNTSYCLTNHSEESRLSVSMFEGGGGVFMWGRTNEINYGFPNADPNFNMNAKFTMNGGTISNNTSQFFGGGVRVRSGTFTLNNGNIIDNTARYGAGVSVSSMFEVMLGSVGPDDEGMVYIGGGTGQFIVRDNKPGYFNMHGGLISNNTATLGGGVYVDNTPGWPNSTGSFFNVGQFNMFGGVISKNTAEYGGGVFLRENLGDVYYNGGSFVGDSLPEWLPFFVMTDNNGFDFQAGSILNNTATYDGGGIFVAAHPENYRTPLVATDFSNLTVGAGAIFSGNTAGNGAFLPHESANLITRIASRNRSISWHPLNNYDINSRGEPIETTLVTVTFLPGTNGTFANYVTYIAFQVPVGTVLTAANVPNVTENADWTHIGWATNPMTNPVGFEVNEDVTFVAQYSPVPVMVTVTFLPGTNGTFVNNVAYITFQVPVGTILTAADIPNILENADWDFIGWATNPMTNPVGFVVNADVTFVAQYETTYNGGSPNTGIYGFAIGAIALVTLGGVMFVFVKKADKATV